MTYTRHRPTKFNDVPTIDDAWWDEIERFEMDDADLQIAALAELADELDDFAIEASEDESFVETYQEWNEYILEHQLWLALEQCCYQSVLLPMGQRDLRVKTCPKEMLGHLSCTSQDLI